MNRIVDDMRKAAGLPPLTDAEKEAAKQTAERIGRLGQRMQATGCGLTIVTLLFLILLAVLF